MDDNFQGIDDRIFDIPMYGETVNENRLYYIYKKDNQYITVSGTGDPHNLEDLRWTCSQGAKRILNQILEVESGYSPQGGFIKFDDYKNDIYIQIARFEIIYKDGWRFSRSNLGDVVEKMSTKKRVYVKASKRSKAHYRMQEVGREEIDPDVTDIWRIPLDKFENLISGDKTLLKEKYIDEHQYKSYDSHPKLQDLMNLMDKDQTEWMIPIIGSFDSDPSRHLQAIYRRLGAHEKVPLRVLKDYPEAAYSYEIDISDDVLEQEPPQGEIKHICEMTKGEYDSIIESVEKDYEKDPKKITDTMLNQYYGDELDDVKRAAKFRKKVFDKLPRHLQDGYTPETMNGELHKRVILYIKDHIKIPNDVKAGYPTLFKDVPFTYSPTGNKNNDDTINSVLGEIRDKCGDDISRIGEVVDKIIESSGELVQMNYSESTTPKEKILMGAGVNDISRLISPELFNKIKSSGIEINMKYDKNRKRANFDSEENNTINLGYNDINVEKVSYSENTIVHEYGHAIEHMRPEIANASRKFLLRRTQGDPEVKLADIHPHAGYDDWEMTRVDHFMSSYIGKSYAAATEVLSMGMGYLTSDIQRIYEKDPEYLGLILASLSGKIVGDPDE